MQALVRLATEADAASIRDIYTPFCESTPTSFELHPPSLEEMRERMLKISAQFPWLVAVYDRAVVGYAYACAHRERAAYRWAVDTAVYIGNSHRRRGVGRALYTALFNLLVRQGYYKAYAGITLPNPGSVGLHEAMGFEPVGVYRGVGYKLGAWHDVGWWQLQLQAEVPVPAEPVTIGSMVGTTEFETALRAGSQMLRK